MSYIAHWRKQTPEPATAKTGKKAKTGSPYVQIRIFLDAWDDASYFCIDEVSPKTKQFKGASEQRFTGDDARRQAIEAYRQLVEKFMSPGPDAATPLYCSDSVPGPEDLDDARVKTADELCLDQAILCLEINEFDAAENWLKQVAEEFRDQSMFAHSIARRLYMNKSRRMLGDAEATEAGALRDRAVAHAVKVIELYKALAAVNEYAAEQRLYYFGRAYNSAGSQVSVACETAAEVALNYAGRPDVALDYCEFGDATNYGKSSLTRLHVKALLKLDRAPEAWKMYAVWHDSLGDMPEITESAGYKEFIAKQRKAEAEEEAAELAAIRISYADLPAAEESAIDALRSRFSALGERWPEMLRDGRQAVLLVEDDELSTTYQRLSPQESLDAHDEMLNWIHLHDDDPAFPEFAADRAAALKKAGIDLEQMLPIIGGNDTPDCFLLRLDGGKGKRGAVYQWSHEEIFHFEKVVDDLDKIFPFLAECGEKGIRRL